MQTNGQWERPTTGEPRDVPTDEPPTDQVRLSVAEAARALGITEGAVRSRIKRGTLPTIKEAGNVFVLWGDGTSRANHTPYTDVPTDVPPEASPGEPSDQAHHATELVESLREQVDYLKGQLDAEGEAGRGKDHLLARALERIPAAIEPPTEDPAPEAAPATPGQPESAPDEGGGVKAGADASSAGEGHMERRSWWRRLFG